MIRWVFNKKIQELAMDSLSLPLFCLQGEEEIRVATVGTAT